MVNSVKLSRLQFITDGNTAESTMAQALEALCGGCRFIQVRMKNADREELARLLSALMPMVRFWDAKLVVDDDVSLARLCDGVHLGRNDMPPDEARTILGPDKLIGVTVNDFSDIDRIAGMPFDTIGLGPWRFTSTKAKLAPTLGRDGTAKLIAALRQRGIRQPVYAIGGITANDVPDVASSGAYGVAIAGAIAHSDNPVFEAKCFLETLNNNY